MDYKILIRAYHVLMLLFLLSTTTFSANYYFSSDSGNDSYTTIQAQNLLTPWKTLAKLNSFMSNLLPGDSVLFKRGEVFYGSLTITKSGTATSPIVFSAYGLGPKPTITGLTSLTGWTAQGSNIWESDCPECDTVVNMLNINGSPKPMGRYPNITDPDKGYLTFEGNSTLQITDNELQAIPDWTGAELVVRSSRWTFCRRRITSHIGTAIHYNVATNYPLTNNNGYFIQNSPQTLDQDGEWYFNPITKKVLVYTNSVNPSLLNIAVATRNNLISIDHQNYLTFDNLEIDGANFKAVDAACVAHLSIKNCDFNCSGTETIRGYDFSNLLIENNIIKNTNNSALNIEGSHVTVQNNMIKYSGIAPGWGAGGGISIVGNNNQLLNNRIDSTGYIPISFQGDSILIQNNFINTYAFTLDDGGGIYTWNGCPSEPNWIYGVDHFDRKIIGNIVINGIGAYEGTDSHNYKAANGIYLDDNVMNVEVTGNTVANCGLNGLFLHNAYNNIVKSNTAYNCATQLNFEGSGFCQTDPIVNNGVKSNILFSKQQAQRVSSLYANAINNVNTYGQFDSNYYCRPFYEENIISVNSAAVNESYTLPEWKAAYNQDAHSHITPLQFPTYVVNYLIGSNKYSNGAFNSNINGASCWSPLGTCATAWDNTGVLDTACLKFSFSSFSGQTNSSLLMFNIGAIDSTKKYIVRFSLKGTKTNRNIDVNLRRQSSPYTNLAPFQSCKVLTTRTENEFLFCPSVSEAVSYLQFNIEEPDSTVWFDNISIYVANVTTTNPDDYLRFEYNATQSPKTVALATPCIDVKNNYYSGSLTLQPFASIILLKQIAAANLVNITIAGGMTNCYNATQTITVAGNGNTFTVQSGGNTTMIAGERIAYLPGTSVNLGGYMRGYIAPGGPFCMPPAMPEVNMDSEENPIHSVQSLFKVYPNPTTGTFILEVRGEVGFDKVSVDVYGVMGEKVLSEVLNGERKHEFSLSGRPNGIFFIRVVAGNMSETFKIIKK